MLLTAGGQAAPEIASVLPFAKQLLYYCLLVLLTLLAVEGMARLAYFLAFDKGYRSSASMEFPGAEDIPPAKIDFSRIRHPWYGYTAHWPDYALNNYPTTTANRDGVVVVGLIGGSVAAWALPAFRQEVERYFQEHNLNKNPVIVGLGFRTMRQPQQAMIAAHALLQGRQFDVIVNLDGFNETQFLHLNAGDGVPPTFPDRWSELAELTPRETRLVGQIVPLRQRQSELVRTSQTSRWRHSAVFGILNRYQLQRTRSRIDQLNRQLAAITAHHNLAKGPIRPFADIADLHTHAVRVWYRSSLLLAQLAELGGAQYYHFLQPNQYAPGAKPLTDRELACCYRPGSYFRENYPKVHPQLVDYGRKLRRQKVNYFDLTRIFADNHETLYADNCCHFNARGNELLAAAMVERIAPALQRAAADSGRPVSPLAAGAAAH